MKNKLSILMLVIAVLISACVPTATSTPAPLAKLNVCYSAPDAGIIELWYAQDNGLFAKYGLEVNATLISSGSSSAQALIAGDVDMCLMAGAAVINAVAAGQDLVLIAGLQNKYVAGFYTTPDIKTGSDLRGKNIGISKPGSSSSVGAALVLKSFGLDPNKDVTIISIGGSSERLTAMLAGQISGSILSPPQSILAEQNGLHKLFDLTTSDIPYQFFSVATSRSFVASNRPMATSFMKALIESIARVKSDPDGAKATLAKYLDLDPLADAAILDGSYADFVTKSLQSVPYPTLPGIQTVIDTSIDDNPALASITPDQVVDISIVQELENNGFISSVQP